MATTMQQFRIHPVEFLRRHRRHRALPLSATVFLTATLALPVLAASEEPSDEEEEIEVYDSRSCPEIFGDEAVVEANRKRRQSRFHGVKRGENDLTVTHQVAWWSEPQKLRIPAAVVVDVLPEDEEGAASDAATEPAADASTNATKTDAASDSGSEAEAAASAAKETPQTDVAAEGVAPEGSAAEGAASEASLFDEEKKAANAGAGLVVQHGSIANPRTAAALNAEELAVAHVELGEAYRELCQPGVYEVSVDDSLGQDARVYAVLEEGMLIESRDSLAFLVLDDGPKPPAMRMIWRSAYAIAFEDAAASSKVKKAKKKPAKKKPRRRRRRKR